MQLSGRLTSTEVADYDHFIDNQASQATPEDALPQVQRPADLQISLSCAAAC